MNQNPITFRHIVLGLVGAALISLSVGPRAFAALDAGDVLGAIAYLLLAFALIIPMSFVLALISVLIDVAQGKYGSDKS